MAKKSNSQIRKETALRQAGAFGKTKRMGRDPVPTTPNNYKSKIIVERNDLVEDASDSDIAKMRQRSKSAQERLREIGDRDFTDMATNVFDSLKELRDELGIPTVGETAVRWMRDTIRALNDLADISTEEKFIRDEKRLITKRAFKREGQMFMFNYQPLHKAKMPYYDSFPCVYILKLQTDGFLGINFHYLPPILRERLFLNLLKFKSGNYESDTTRLILIYEILMSKPLFRHYLKPCIKKYLYNRIDSYMLRIPPEDWYIATFLPLSRFHKKHRTGVYKEVRLEILRDRLNYRLNRDRE